MSNDNTKKKASPFAKKEITTANPVAEEQPKVVFYHESKVKPNQWLGKRTREDAFGEVEEDEHSGEAEEDSDLEDASMDDQESPEELQTSIVDSMRKEFIQLRSIMFAFLLQLTPRNSKSQTSLPSISLDLLQATQAKVEMVTKYLSDTSK